MKPNDFEQVLRARISRRGALKTLAVGGTLATAGGLPGLAIAGEAGDPSSLGFKSPQRRITADHHAAPGYSAQVLIRWGDAVVAGAPPFNPLNQSADAQEKQFGYNNDFVAYLPLPVGSENSEHGLLCVNHEFTDAQLMFPGLTLRNKRDKLTREQADVELAAHGHAIIEVRREAGAWQVVKDSRYGRRLTLRSTPMKVSGPAAGHRRLRTNADPAGRRVIGTMNNCAGGVTPWGTVLVAEENFHQYFGGDPDQTGEGPNYRRYGIRGKARHPWANFFPRFNLAKEPNEPNRFGWVVEYDPYDPESVPVKRTALGRFKHEAATCMVNSDGRLVVYSGDDQRFEYLYRFVSNARVDTANREANRDLLDEGTLYVARFDADGTATWLPLVWGKGPLSAKNGFSSQADVMIETRKAADLLGATKMDRPEDVETNPVNGRVYVMLTNNTKRGQPDPANPRRDNRYGHILEMTPPGENGKWEHAADKFNWDILLLAGDPGQRSHQARYHEDIGRYGDWLAKPDNCCFDNRGRLWISTDQGFAQRANGIPDGMYACDVDGPGRALTKFFYAVPVDAEMCGPCFTPDNRTLFVAVQHPGQYLGSTFESPSTRWPDFSAGMPPRPSIVAITKDDGDLIGG